MCGNALGRAAALTAQRDRRYFTLYELGGLAALAQRGPPDFQPSSFGSQSENAGT